MNILNTMEKHNKFGTIYHGQVVDIEDPTKQGRIKVKIEEVYGDTEKENLPWIYPIGYNSGLRLFHVPDLETEVGVIFIGDFYTGFYGIGKYPKGEAKVFDEDYPKVYGFEDAQGNYLTINKETGFVKFYHRSKAEITLDDEGNINAKTPGKVNIEIAKDVTIKASENVKIDIAEKVDVSAKEANLVAPKVKIKGDTTMEGKLTVTDTCIFEGIVWKTHVHPYHWTDGGGSSNSKAPQNG